MSAQRPEPRPTGAALAQFQEIADDMAIVSFLLCVSLSRVSIRLSRSGAAARCGDAAAASFRCPDVWLQHAPLPVAMHVGSPTGVASTPSPPLNIITIARRVDVPRAQALGGTAPGGGAR